jgi:hypothetical protein
MVKGIVNGYEFIAALEPDGNGSHWLNIDKHLQNSAALDCSKPLTLSIEPTKIWPEPAVPSDWQTVLDNNQQIQDLWLAVTPMARWEWLRWIGATNRAETRHKRIGVACSKLLRGERRPCCFNRSMCCVPEVSKNGVLLESSSTTKD